MQKCQHKMLFYSKLLALIFLIKQRNAINSRDASRKQCRWVSCCHFALKWTEIKNTSIYTKWLRIDYTYNNQTTQRNKNRLLAMIRYRTTTTYPTTILEKSYTQEIWKTVKFCSKDEYKTSNIVQHQRKWKPPRQNMSLLKNRKSKTKEVSCWNFWHQ